MSLSSSKGQLKDAHKRLNAAWDHVRDEWRDAAARDFQKQLLEPMNASVRSALSAMDQMDETLRQVERDCGND